MAATAAPGAAGPGMAAGAGPGAAVVAAGPGAVAGGGGAAVKSGEERLKEMEAEMALFEQEVLGAPGPAPGDPLAPPPVLRPIIATNTYQQVQQSLEARAAAAATVPPLGTPPVPFVGPAVSPQRPPILRPAFVPHVLQRPAGPRGPLALRPPPGAMVGVGPPLGAPPAPPLLLAPPPLQRPPPTPPWGHPWAGEGRRGGRGARAPPAPVTPGGPRVPPPGPAPGPPKPTPPVIQAAPTVYPAPPRRAPGAQDWSQPPGSTPCHGHAPSGATAWPRPHRTGATPPAQDPPQDPPFPVPEVGAEPAAEDKRKGRGERLKRCIRTAAGSSWEDPSLLEWDADNFQLFCGDLGNEVYDEVLDQVMAPRSPMSPELCDDPKTSGHRGYGFVSFKDPNDYIRAMREMNGKYVGSRPIKLRKSQWKDRNLEVVRRKQREKKKLGLR
ncbi:RNA-binding protein 42 [Agelaius phoeniceus]|uniref:RNA-binding protein 42 n=1 Tax=Agelaius phoeniceus TaxID=39638 RepID=UPI004054D98A